MLLLLLLVPVALCRVLLLGYLTGSARRPGDLEYPRPGLTISGAISLAAGEANQQLASRGLQLRFLVAETHGNEKESIRRTAELWTRNVSVYIGPQETCVHEGRMAAAFNVPMISYFCTHSETSNKRDFPTFARTRPPDTQISKSVAAVLLHFNWKHVIIILALCIHAVFSKPGGGGINGGIGFSGPEGAQRPADIPVLTLLQSSNDGHQPHARQVHRRQVNPETICSLAGCP